MNFGKREIFILVGFAVAVVVTVVAWNWNSKPVNEAIEGGTWWVCTDAAKHEYNLSPKQFAEHQEKNWGQPVKCPTCGKDASRAQKCQHCGKLYVRKRNDITCAHCGKENKPID